METVNRYFGKKLDLDERPQNVAFHHGPHCLHLEIITCEPSISTYNKIDGKLHGSIKGDNFLIVTIKQNARFQFPLIKGYHYLRILFCTNQIFMKHYFSSVSTAPVCSISRQNYHI